tara:strand:+ start:3145 stop:3630 length:486 start_codon:yes stop_codon:yes gene_type:complete
MDENITTKLLSERISALETKMDMLVKLLSTKGFPPNEDVGIVESKTQSVALSSLISLTPKQAAVLQMIHANYSMADMQACLQTTESTIKAHIQALFKKFKVRNRNQLILKTVTLFDEIKPQDYLRYAGIPKDYADTWLKRNKNMVACNYTQMLRKRKKDGT